MQKTQAAGGHIWPQEIKLFINPWRFVIVVGPRSRHCQCLKTLRMRRRNKAATLQPLAATAVIVSDRWHERELAHAQRSCYGHQHTTCKQTSTVQACGVQAGARPSPGAAILAFSQARPLHIPGLLCPGTGHVRRTLAGSRPGSPTRNLLLPGRKGGGNLATGCNRAVEPPLQ
jgi:hypothetical protein